MTEHSVHNPEQDPAKSEQFLTKPKDLQEWGAKIDPLLQQATEAVATREHGQDTLQDAVLQLDNDLHEKRRAVSEAIKARDQEHIDKINEPLITGSQEEREEREKEIRAITDAIEKLEEQQEALKNEDIYQHPSLEYLKVPMSDLQEEERKRKWQMDGLSRNEIRLFGDEADLSRFDKFLKPAADLPDNFSLPASDIDAHMDPKEAEALLDQLPYVEPGLIQNSPDRENPVVRIAGGVPFPVERIVSLPASEKWAGGPNKAAHIGGYEHLYPEGVPNSAIGKIIAYASRRVPTDEVKLRIFKDAAGEYWAATRHDSSHRLAAAKLRGETTIIPKEITIESEDEMTTVPFSVRKKFAKSSN